MPNLSSNRYSRNEGLLGIGGQRAIDGTPVAIVSLGGFGSHVAQQPIHVENITTVITRVRQPRWGVSSLGGASSPRYTTRW